MTKFPLLAALAFLLAAVLPALAAGELLIESGDADTARVEAPCLFTRAYSVTNTAAVGRDFTESVLLPPGWRNVTADSLFSLASGARDVRLLCIAIPGDAAPGTYLLRYLVHDRNDMRRGAESILHLLVLPVMKLDMTVAESPRWVMAGEEYAVRLELFNHSNVHCPVTLQAKNTSGTAVRLSEQHIEMKPGERRILVAHIETNRRIQQTEQQWLTVRAETAVNDLQSAAQTTSMVSVVPRPNQGDDLYHRVPSRLAVRYVGAAEENGLQMELDGSGTLDSRGNYQVEYKFRGPRDLERHLYGLRDEYFVSVKNQSGELQVGDLPFNLSPLTERNRLGRGAKGVYRSGPFVLGAYSFASRAKYPDVSENAAFVGLAARGLDTRLNFLDKTASGVRRSLGSLSIQSRFFRHTPMEAEIGAGQSLMNSQKTAYALRGRIGRDLPLHARLSAEKSYAQPGFPGYYSNQDHSNVSLFVPLRSRTHWQTSYNYFIQNLERDTSRSTALREQQVLSGVYWTLPFRTQINLDVESIFRRDALPQQDYHRREQSANLRVRQPFRWLTVGGQIREGTWRDPSNGASGQLERFGGNLTLSPDSRHSYTFSYQTGHSGSQSRTNRIFGLSASLRPLAGLFFSASWQTSDYPDHTPYGSRQLAVDARYTFLRRHTFSLRYRQLEFEEEYLSRGTSWMISYELPLGMPVGRQEKFGAVKGRIRDAERTGQAGLPNVVLMLDGKMALTDRKGNFVFPALEPGVHYLQVEKSSIGLDRVASRRVPLEVKVRGGRTEMVDLGIFRGATLCGEVALFGLGAASARGIFVEADSTMAHDAMDSLNYLYGLSGIEVELRSESETRHAATDCNGRFRFDELRPGRWTLAIASADLPPFHDLESETYVVEIEPASQNDFAVRVVPRRRSVIIVDEGKVPVISKRR